MAAEDSHRVRTIWTCDRSDLPEEAGRYGTYVSLNAAAVWGMSGCRVICESDVRGAVGYGR